MNVRRGYRLAVRLLYVTSSFPFGHGEWFLVAEVNELEAQGHEVVVLPALARGPLVHEDARPLLARTWKTPLESRAVARSSFREVRSRPAASGRELAQLRQSRSGRILLKNVAAFPKSLWAAQLVRELG